MATTDEYNIAKAAVSSAASRVSSIEGQISSYQADVDRFTKDLADSKSNPALADLIPSQTTSLSAATGKVTTLQAGLVTAQATLTAAQTTLDQTIVEVKQDPASTVKTPEATNPSATAAATTAANADSTNVTPAPNPSISQTNAGIIKAITSKPSAVAPKVTPATPTFQGGKDHRVRLKVPTTYLVGQAAGPNNTLVKSQGIIFPYTPTIGQEYSATYNSVPLVHTNYTQYFYKNSAVSTISLSAKFTVQNDYEAEMYFSVIHLLRALTKMRWGDDENAGSPPPVCRLFAYGDAIMNNVPVAISSVKIDLPDNVDYFTANSLSGAPVLSTISMTLTPIYSRNEMQQFTVSDYLNSGIRSKGYL